MTVVKLRRRVPPLRKTYRPEAPFIVEQDHCEDGSITYEVVDTRPESFHTVCGINDGCDGELEEYGLEGGPSHAKRDAEKIVRALNLLVALGKETP